MSITDVSNAKEILLQIDASIDIQLNQLYFSK